MSILIAFLLVSFVTSTLVVVVCVRSAQISKKNGMPETEQFEVQTSSTLFTNPEINLHQSY